MMARWILQCKGSASLSRRCLLGLISYAPLQATCHVSSIGHSAKGISRDGQYLTSEAIPYVRQYLTSVPLESGQKEGRALRQFTLNTGKSAGRNSAGRITVFHRGGGSKRLHRRIDLKRSTSSMGIVERIEYDPNRSSRIALVRWIEGVPLGRQRKCNMIEEIAPPQKILERTTTTIRSPFSFSSLPGKVDQRKVACFSPGLMTDHVVVGLPTRMPPWSNSPFTSKGAGRKKTCAKDVFFSALSSPRAKGETASLSFGSSFCFPRIAVAGAKPTFFAPRMRENVRGFSLCEIQTWRTHSILWAHRIKRKAALSWQSFRRQETLGLVGAAEHNESKPKVDIADVSKLRNYQFPQDAGPMAHPVRPHLYIKMDNFYTGNQ